MMVRLVILILTFLTFQTPSFAELIALNSGKVFDAKIISYSDNDFNIVTAKGEQYTIPYRMVNGIKSSRGNNSTKKNLNFVQKKVSYAQQLTSVRNKELARKVRSKKVEFYMTNWCPYCRKMETFLKKSGINYKSYNIEQSKSARSKFKRLGGVGVPLTKVGDVVIKGYDPDSVWNALQK